MTGRSLLLFVLAAAAGGCVQRTYQTVEVASLPVEPQEGLQTAHNLPRAFVVVTAARREGDCPPRLSDPALRTTLDLQESVLMPVRDSAGIQYRAYGNYTSTPRGRYGEGEGQGLRIDCERLAALGVVALRR